MYKYISDAQYMHAFALRCGVGFFVVSADNWNGLEDYSDGSLYQGDQIGRIFDYWLIGIFLNLHKYPKIWATFFKD
jgi:hypothetical protein